MGLRIITIGALAVAALLGQAHPKFEVASIRPSGQQPLGQANIGMHIDGAQVRCNYLSLKDYLGTAYKLKNYQVSGPDWIGSDRFDISAKLPEGANRDQVPEMLQDLLGERFKLKMHRETKPFPVYGLVVAKGGLKLHEVPVDSDSENAPIDVSAAGGRGGVSVQLGRGSSFSFGDNRLTAKKMTMTAFADLLARFMDRPVVDMTETKGAYDISLEVTPEDYRTMLIRSAIAAGVTLPPEAVRLLENASDSSLHTALQGLGLRLEGRKAPIEVLVVDQAERNPSEN